METRVLDTKHEAKAVVRRHRCGCGARWTSDATLRAGSLELPLVGMPPPYLAIATPTNGAPLNHMDPTPTNGRGSLSSPDPGLLFSGSDPDLSKPNNRSPNKMRLQYSAPFEAAWRLYPRRDEKALAYAQWKYSAKDVGEDSLAALVIAALRWQVPTLWDGANWRYAKYFSRYLKARKWEDEQPSPGQAARGSKNGAALSAWMELQRK